MRGPFVAAVAFLAMLSSCALVSGLDRLTLEEEDRADASMDGAGDVADARGMSDATAEADASDAIVDADARDADASDAASIQCGTTSCPTPSQCCNIISNGKPSFTCVKAGTCTGSNHFVMGCDVASCPSNQKCCVSLETFPQQYATSATCATTCSGPTTAPLCKANVDCNVGTCKASYGLTGYLACGL